MQFCGKKIRPYSEISPDCTYKLILLTAFFKFNFENKFNYCFNLSRIHSFINTNLLLFSSSYKQKTVKIKFLTNFLFIFVPDKKFCNIEEDCHHAFHSLHVGVLSFAVGTVTAVPQIGTGEPHKAEPCPVGAAPNGSH